MEVDTDAKHSNRSGDPGQRGACGTGGSAGIRADRREADAPARPQHERRAALGVSDKTVAKAIERAGSTLAQRDRRLSVGPSCVRVPLVLEIETGWATTGSEA